jgi:AraC-like DNA-binding protein
LVEIIDDTTFRRLCRSRDFIGDRYTDPIRLADAAAEACLSKFHFQRMFQRVFSETPHEFLTRRRMERARILLATKSMSVTEVCMEVGYSSLGSFSTRFQQTFGISPSDYRARVRTSVPVIWPGWQLFVPSCMLRFWGL